MMVAILKHDGTTARSSEMLKISEDPCQVMSTVPEHSSWYVVGAGCFLYVYCSQGPPDICYVQTERLLIRMKSGFPRRSVVFCLKSPKIFI